MIGFAVIVGVVRLQAARPSISLSLVLGFVTGFAICGYSMVINDYYDIEVDRVNQPDRPLPSGADLATAGPLALALAMLAVGVVASAVLLSWAAVGSRPALRPALVALQLQGEEVRAVGQPHRGLFARDTVHLRWGGLGGSVTSSLLLFMAGTAFLSGVGREVVKAMADTVGDEKRGIRSFARVHGMRPAAAAGAALLPRLGRLEPAAAGPALRSACSTGSG